jgi:hypothetical protein
MHNKNYENNLEFCKQKGTQYAPNILSVSIIYVN